MEKERDLMLDKCPARSTLSSPIYVLQAAFAIIVPLEVMLIPLPQRSVSLSDMHADCLLAQIDRLHRIDRTE